MAQQLYRKKKLSQVFLTHGLCSSAGKDYCPNAKSVRALTVVSYIHLLNDSGILHQKLHVAYMPTNQHILLRRTMLSILASIN